MYSLIGKWAILPGNEKKVIAALKKLAKEVQKNEPDTLIYMVHMPNFKEKSLPTPPAGELIFFEVYNNKAGFLKHINGPAYTNFVKKYGNLFLQDYSTPPQLFMITEVMTQISGFARNNIK